MAIARKNMTHELRGHWRAGRVVVLVLTGSVFGPALWAQNGTPAKAPFNVVSIDFGGNAFLPLSSSANVPTQSCPSNSPSNKACAEQLSKGGGVEFGFAIRPKRHLAFGFGGEVLSNFNNSTYTTAPYQCVSGCNGTVNENISTLHLLFTIDGRGVLPLFGERLVISAGGGIGLIDLHQRPLTGGASVQGGCTSCQPDMTGEGPTEILEVKYLPGGADGLIGLGLEVRGMQIRSKGLNYTNWNIGGNRYTDQLMVIGLGMTLNFGKHH